ncbi:MAG: LuxR C-terminal-related transcriptional regulator, partial [Actinomycetes bacterium]
MTLKLYADTPTRRVRQIVADVWFVVWVFLWIWLGIRLHDLIVPLGTPGEKLQSAGESLASNMTAAGTWISELPLVGGSGSSAFEKMSGAAQALADAAPAEIARAIESVASGFTHYPAHLTTALDKRDREPMATQRERELLPYIARGMTAKEIARELTHMEPGSPIIDRTVEVHKGNIKRKFRLDSA